MIQVNLLPIRAQKRKENLRQFISVYVLSIALLLSAMAYFWISLRNETQRLERREAQLRSEVNQYQKYDRMLKELQKKKQIIDKKRGIIKELQNDRDRVVRILAVLGVELPTDKVWFEKLSLSGNSITLNGVALSNEAIAEFMRNLESSPYVEKASVNLALSRQVTMSNMKLREFQLTYRFLPFSVVREKLKTKQTDTQTEEDKADKS
jgi:type IV pilus assembly protein PilN